MKTTRRTGRARASGVAIGIATGVMIAAAVGLLAASLGACTAILGVTELTPPAEAGTDASSGAASGSGSGASTGSSGSTSSGSGEADATSDGPAGSGSGSAGGSGGDGSTGPDDATSSSGGLDSSTEGGAASPDGSTSGGTDSGAACGSYTPPTCGTGSCDLRMNTCCINPTAQTTRCVSGAASSCNLGETADHCTSACDCSGGKVCCGTLSTASVGAFTSACQSVAEGGHCTPYPSTSTEGSAQLCTAASECVNGEACVAQTCVFGTKLNACGLQGGAPYNCTTP
jgi:hypothetical protein